MNNVIRDMLAIDVGLDSAPEDLRDLVSTATRQSPVGLESQLEEEVRSQIGSPPEQLLIALEYLAIKQGMLRRETIQTLGQILTDSRKPPLVRSSCAWSLSRLEFSNLAQETVEQIHAWFRRLASDETLKQSAARAWLISDSGWRRTAAFLAALSALRVGRISTPDEVVDRLLSVNRADGKLFQRMGYSPDWREAFKWALATSFQLASVRPPRAIQLAVRQVTGPSGHQAAVESIWDTRSGCLGELVTASYLFEVNPFP